jgi:hypothetical protein
VNTMGGPRDMKNREAYFRSREETKTTYLFRLMAKRVHGAPIQSVSRAALFEVYAHHFQIVMYRYGICNSIS